MSIEKILKFVFAAIGIALFLFLFPSILRVFAPFILAFLVAILSQRLVSCLEKKLRINRGISSAIIVTTIVATATGLIFAIVFQLFSQTKNLISSLPVLIDSLSSQFARISEKFNIFKLSLPQDFLVIFDNAYNQLSHSIENISGSVTNYAFNAAKNFASSLPKIILFLTMFLLSTFFFTKDYRLIINFFREILPEHILKRALLFKKIIAQAFSSYMKAQLILMLMTTLLIIVCFWIVGIEYALVWGIVCGLVDLLPFFGTAIIILPLAIISLIYGDIYSFISLCIIQIIVFVFRQLAEPRVISKQIGIHPLLTLLSVYIGLKYFGFIGVILAPIFTLLAVNLYISYKENSIT